MDHALAWFTNGVWDLLSNDPNSKLDQKTREKANGKVHNNNNNNNKIMKHRKRISNPLSGKPRTRPSSVVSHLVIVALGMACCAGLLWHLLMQEEDNTIIIDRYTNITTKTTETIESSSWTTVEQVRHEFRRRYNNLPDTADAMWQRGVESFGSIEATARRMLQSAAKKQPFVLSFAGYSVTVGRGNHYQQSFPFVLERVLRPLLRSTLDLEVVVRNSAIGGIPSFPYAFCFSHFLGHDAQVISWDFSMNEGRGAAVLESYLRQSQHQLPNRPMVIVLDTNKQRCQLLKKYTELGLLSDAMCVGMAKDVVLNKDMLELPDDEKAPGFQHWNEFGAPPQCPGRGSWHPKKMEHELIGWMMAMYFVKAVEEAERIMQREPDWKSVHAAKPVAPLSTFPKLLSTVPQNNPGVTDLLFGHTNDASSYQMKALSCRTNFLPATDHDKVLPSIVVSGLSPGITAENIMEERSDEAYKNGWVLDVSKVERGTKIKVEKCGGLGYVDLKTALYGVPESGVLKLWLPFEGTSHHEHDHSSDDTIANHWFDELIVCEANEKRPKNACHLDTDIVYTVGGVAVESATMINGAGEYLKRQTCAHVGIPTAAKITRLREVADGQRKFEYPEDHVGLMVELAVKTNVSREHGACCLSHIVWEQH